MNIKKNTGKNMHSFRYVSLFYSKETSNFR